jgi:hypothetical protein
MPNEKGISEPPAFMFAEGDSVAPLKAMRFCLSAGDIPSPMPNVLASFKEIPAASIFRGPIHNASRTNSSCSFFPELPLQTRQLGAFHLWTDWGVESGYQEAGKT